MKQMNREVVTNKMNRRLKMNTLAKWIFFGITLLILCILVILLVRIFSQGMAYFDWHFLTNFASRRAENAGILGPLVGSLMLMVVVIPIALILGIGTAIYLEEYAKKNWFTHFIETNIQNLAGVPSIVFGLLGLTIFVNVFGMGPSILAGGLTLALLVLPIIVVTAQEAIRAVPNHLAHASLGLGATKWQTIQKVILPSALPGILTGSILALSRAIGETAPLIVVGALVFVNYLPSGFMDGFAAIPIQIYNWTIRPQEEFQQLAAAGIILMLILLIVLNATAVWLRNKLNRKQQ
ncbi:MAG TPA: phosphate ABC transporter permease PstA [Firmicutes bacterium]|nr:phosphate ABC transporter permease PstA [Bacillales bacterium]HJA42229.1 phosphate ABC transporter permease PstA [Bacillota bacterium]